LECCIEEEQPRFRDAMTKTRCILNSLWFAIIAVGLAVMLTMLIWSNHLASDFSLQYGRKDFYQRILPIFFLGEVLAFSGCLGLSVTLPFKTAIGAGLRTVGASFVLFFMLHLFGLASFHDMTEASAFFLSQAVFSCGCVLAIIGSLRLGWTKLRSQSC
jgi:hypothetical protein